MMLQGVVKYLIPVRKNVTKFLLLLPHQPIVVLYHLIINTSSKLEVSKIKHKEIILSKCIL